MAEISNTPPGPRRGWPRWAWLALAGVCVVLLLLQALLRHTSGGAELGSGGAGARSRTPFPKGGEFSDVHRRPTVGPRDDSAPEPWQDGRKGK